MSRPLLLLIALCCACGDDGPSPEALIVSPRILAVQAEPPVVSIEEVAALRALVVDSDGELGEVSPTFRACYPWLPMVSPERDCGSDSSIPLPDGVFSPSQVIEAFPPPPGFSDGISGQPSSACSAAYSSWDFPIVVEATTDGQTVVASKRVRVIANPLEQSRRNPRIENLLFDGETKTESVVAIRGAGTYDVSLAVAGEEVDAVCDDEEPTEIALEELAVNFYATGGVFLGSSVGVELGLDGQEAIGTTQWSIEEPRGAITMWLVITDREGGIGWSQYTLEQR